MARRAAKVDENHHDVVVALKRIGCRVQSLAAVGGGCPDVLVLWRDRLYLLEIKAPGGRLNKAQREWHESWCSAPLAVVSSPGEAVEAVGRMWQEAQP